MPVIRNSGDSNIVVLNSSRSPVNLAPGETISTYFYPTDPSAEVVSDTPLWSLVVSRASIDLADIPAEYESDIEGFDGAVVPISAETASVYVMKITGQITVYRQAPDTEPELKDRDDASPYLPIDAQRTLTKLCISGTGEIEIVQYRNPL